MLVSGENAGETGTWASKLCSMNPRSAKFTVLKPRALYMLLSLGGVVRTFDKLKLVGQVLMLRLSLAMQPLLHQK